MTTASFDYEQQEDDDDMDTRFASMLEDYRKAYVAFHMNPESSELRNSFFQLQRNIDAMQQEPARRKSQIEAQEKQKKETQQALLSRLKREKNQQSSLLQKMNLVLHKKNVFDTMHSDTQSLYLDALWTNAFLVICIALESYWAVKG